MKSLSAHDRLAEGAAHALIALLGEGSASIVQLKDSAFPDVAIKTPQLRFLITAKSIASSAMVRNAVLQLREYLSRQGVNDVPVVAVPFMGEAGQRICADAGINWIDLNGNAHIVAPGLKVIIKGNPNRFSAAGRPSNIFAPKSSRVVRWLLTNLKIPCTQREISRHTQMDEGFVSRIVSRLESNNYVYRIGSVIKVKEPDLLLDDWRASYSFSKHRLIQGHVAARSGDALLRLVHDVFTKHKTEYAATGLAAAWAYTHFAAFRMTTIYVSCEPELVLLDELGYRKDERGANLSFVLPNDEGVLQGAVEADGIHCVHPVQAYLDLKEQPERANEAADSLRAAKLNWKDND